MPTAVSKFAAPATMKAKKAGRQADVFARQVAYGWSLPDQLMYVASHKVRPTVVALLDVLYDTTAALRESTNGARQELGRVLDPVLEQLDKVGKGVAGAAAGCRCAMGDVLARLTLSSSSGKKLSDCLPVGFVVTLLQLLYGAFVFVYMPAAGLALNSPPSMAFHAIMFLTLSSFVRAAKTNPGYVPQAAEWRERQSPEDAHRWCPQERCYKPERAHYCSAMKLNVLRYDHFCPWLGNAVGFANHKFFLLFVLYATGACALLGISVHQLLASVMLPAVSQSLLIGAESLAVLLGGVLAPFLGFHTWLLCRNLTTVESLEQRQIHSSLLTMPSPYDLGVYSNICSVMGTSPLLWLLPVGQPEGDGLCFRTDTEVQRVALQGTMESRSAAGSGGALVCGDEDSESAGSEVEGSEVDLEADVKQRESSEESSYVAAWWSCPAEFATDLTAGCFLLCDALVETAKGASDTASRAVEICSATNFQKTAENRKFKKRHSADDLASVNTTVPDEAASVSTFSSHLTRDSM